MTYNHRTNDLIDGVTTIRFNEQGAPVLYYDGSNIFIRSGTDKSVALSFCSCYYLTADKTKIISSPDSFFNNLIVINKLLSK